MLLAIALVTLAATAALGFGVREAWRRTEEARFEAQFGIASEQLQRVLTESVRELPDLIGPICRHDPVVDSTLVDLTTGRLDSSRRLALSQRIPELSKAMGVDELLLATQDGEILGAGHNAGLVSKREPWLAQRIASENGRVTLRAGSGPLALTAACSRKQGRLAVGLFAARYLEPLLARSAQGTGLSLTLGTPKDAAGLMVRRVTLPEMSELEVFASQSRVPLLEALQRLDSTVFALGAGTVLVALFLGWLLSRGLARPIVSLAGEARQAVHGDPHPVRPRGPRELIQLAEAFNRAISDLADLRRRLAVTERIAARREIARRVAHEIKNPLAPIRAAIETLRRLRAREDPAFDGYFDEATRTVLEEVARITHIVGEFTRFERLPAPEPKEMDLAEAVTSVVRLHDHLCGRVQLVTPEKLTAIADRDQVVQVLTNLVKNALEAVSGDLEAEVRVELTSDDEMARLRVIDHGPGVAPELREKLFQPYVTTKQQGTGLGLAICERIISEHGGTISYEDTPGGGATFVIVLPLAGPAPLSVPQPGDGVTPPALP